MWQWAWFASFCGSCRNANAAHRPQDKRFTFGTGTHPMSATLTQAQSIRETTGFQLPDTLEGVRLPRVSASLLATIRSCWHLPNDWSTFWRTDNLWIPDALMSRHDAGEQAVSYQRLFPCPPCRPMIRGAGLSRNLWVWINHTRCCNGFHKQSANNQYEVTS